MNSLDRLTVVIPARNEEALIANCLDSVDSAADFARRALGDLAPVIDVIVVADACTDGTVAIATRQRGARVIEADFASVGAARSLGARIGLAVDECPANRHWLANTDADSTVPLNWIYAQIEYAVAGYQLMIGTVRPVMADLTPRQRRVWKRTHSDGIANGHVHGANLGIRVDTYEGAGGFRDQSEHEDNDLVDRLIAVGARTVATNTCEVITSGRRDGRTPGGYAGYLREQLVT